jgi:cytoskeletal protein CcmA (bactofilin family)
MANTAQTKSGGAENSSSRPVVLGPKDTMVGKLTVEGSLTVQGTVDGELRVNGDLEVHEAATIKAKVTGRNVSVRGNVTGELTAKNRLVISGSGVINGDVRAAKLQVEDGGTLNGNISMGSSPAPSASPAKTA